MIKKLFTLFVIGFYFNANAQCNNTSFENGTFSGWVGNIGYNANSNTALTSTSATISTLGVNSDETGCSFQTLVTAAAGNDPWGGFPMLDPNGGTYAVRLGGENINTNDDAGSDGCIVNCPTTLPDYYSNGESLQQTFGVTINNTLLTYNYAVVLERAPHPNGEQPYFRIETLDATGTPITCYNYFISGDSAGNYPVGFISSGSVEYLPWQQGSINLLPYLGTIVTVRFTTAGCIPGGHFGYGYVDCACSPIGINVSSPTCSGGIATLTAPPVVQGTYTWTGPGIVSGINSQTATANVSGTYSVTVTYPSGCSYTLNTNLNFSSLPIVTCSATPDTIIAGSTIAELNAMGAITYSWAPAGSLSAVTGSSVAASPIVPTCYTVAATDVNGCENTCSICVHVNSTTGTPLSIGEGQGVRLYPNPNNGLFNLIINQFDNLKMNHIEIYNVTGDCVHRQIATSANCQIDISSLAEGVYNISLQSNEGVVNNRLVIVR